MRPISESSSGAFASRMLTYGATCHFIVPELDLVMMTTAAQYAQPKEGVAAIDILSNIVIPVP